MYILSVYYSYNLAVFCGDVSEIAEQIKSVAKTCGKIHVMPNDMKYHNFIVVIHVLVTDFIRVKMTQLPSTEQYYSRITMNYDSSVLNRRRNIL